MRSPLLVALLLTLAVSACTNDPNHAADFDELNREAVEVTCECFAANGFPSHDACMSSEFSPLPEPVRECLNDAFDLDPRATDHVSCMIGAAQTAIDCYRLRLDCNNFRSLDTCNEQLNNTRARCPTLNADAQNAVALCSQL